MEKVLQHVGNAFSNLANAISEVRNTIHAYLFDLAFEDDHSIQQNDLIISSPRPNPSRTDSRIIVFPRPSGYNHSRILAKNQRF